MWQGVSTCEWAGLAIDYALPDFIETLFLSAKKIFSATPANLLFFGAPALFVVLWSTGFIGAKMGLPYAEPATFLAIRFFAVAAILAVVAGLTGAAWPDNHTDKAHIAAVGLLVHGIYLGGIFGGISLGVTAGDSALIVGMQPILTAVLVGPILGETVRARQWIGFVIGTVGVTLVSWRYIDDLDSTLTGVVLCVVAVMGMSLGTIYQKRFCAQMNLLTGSCIQFLAAALFMLLIAVAWESGQVNWTGEFVFALGWLVIVLSLGAMTLLWLLVRAQAATQVASLFFLVPPVTALIAWPLFGETLTLKSVIGMGLVVLGILLVKHDRSETSRKEVGPA
jgi:drug/metabolite transporter (DMT)-like permease|tara:strand:- start:122 stop:1132 length:1011 start_codon:yes stop_codon:yes gene_type:complete